MLPLMSGEAMLNWRVVVLEKIVLAFCYYKKEKYTSKV
jgi:hypothetical protein